MNSESLTFSYEAVPGRVVFGTGAAASAIEQEVGLLGWRKILVITGAHDRTLEERLTRPIGRLVGARFDGVRPHVPREVAESARRVAAEAGVDGLLSIGGGSTTGTAKAIALTMGLPILAVPTTFSGSEMTSVWGMTAGGRKQTGRDPVVRPVTVVYDPELLATLPNSLAVASGLNAMAHCVEAFWAPGSNPVASLIAGEGITALSAGLRSISGDRGAAQVAREQLLYGAYLAGTAFASAGSGLHHSICHALGGAFDLPHAQTHAVVLPHVLEFNSDHIGSAERRIAVALGADEAAAGLRSLYRDIDAPRTLRELGLTPAQLEEAIEVVSAKLPIDNPRAVERQDIVAILTAAAG